MFILSKSHSKVKVESHHQRDNEGPLEGFQQHMWRLNQL